MSREAKESIDVNTGIETGHMKQSSAFSGTWGWRDGSNSSLMKILLCVWGFRQSSNLRCLGKEGIKLQTGSAGGEPPCFKQNLSLHYLFNVLHAICGINISSSF